MTKAILIKAEDWEGLYVDGKLIEEGHTLNEGMERIKYFCDLGERYNFQLGDLKIVWANDKEEEMLCENGGFPYGIKVLDGDYLNM